MVKLLDSTLREGEQTPGVSFSVEEKLEIASLLDGFGVEFIEAGHPAVSSEIFRAVKEVAGAGLDAEIVAHSRAMRADIDKAVEAGADWVGIFFSVADRRLESQFRKNVDQAVSLISDCVAYAKERGVKVRYTPEDTVRSDFSKVVRVARAAREAGADRIGIADTTGFMTPRRTYDFVQRLIDEVHAPVSMHCHNDLGMAVANSLAAVEAGAVVVDVSVNGLGERTGIAPLAETAAALKLRLGADNPWKLELLPRLSEVVEVHSRIPLSPQAPIVGRNAFSHNAGLHVSAVLQDPAHYESIPAHLVGRRRRMVVDKLSGRDAVRHRLEELGFKVSDGEVDKVLTLVKQRSLNDVADAALTRLLDEVNAAPMERSP
ncbi:MAG: homocitrate synthase [Euryarchaeota archaeon]|nr:homocitrate synthase [Euryarchaeota archaeon]